MIVNHGYSCMELFQIFGIIRVYANPQTTNFDHLFVMCTFLNLGYRDILNDKQVAAAKSHMIKWMTLSLMQQQPQGEATEEVQSATAD